MEKEAERKEKDTMAWIVVLAIAVTLCAILFVVFANYLVAINKNLSAANARLTMMEANEAQLLSEIQALHRAINDQQKPKPANAKLPAPVTQ